MPDPARPIRTNPTRFAFYGRTATADPLGRQVARAWQLARAALLIEPAAGEIVTEYFDTAIPATTPWTRRPRANDLLTALADPDRGFDAVVIPAPERAFHGGQYPATIARFAHYGIGLWVPQITGPLDPDSESHNLIMHIVTGLCTPTRNRADRPRNS